MSDQPGAGGRAFVALQHLLPQHGISRLVLGATRSRNPTFKNALIRLFMRGFKPDMRDAVEPSPPPTPASTKFFTRALRPGTRPVDSDPRAVVSPVDGTVSEAGLLSADRLLQAKGHEYSLRALLAGKRRLGTQLRRRDLRDYLPGAVQLSPHPHAAGRRAARIFLRERAGCSASTAPRAAGARAVLA
jgi:phosphatidylserine decarboxylase